MVIIKLKGGLGNQMFQYAAAFHHILKGKEVKFDISYYDNDSRHGGYWLEKAFNINLVKATKRDVFYFLEKAINEEGNLGYRLKKNRILVEEKPEEWFTHNAYLMHLDDTYFNGYWQNINYFKENEKEVRDLFQFIRIDDTDIVNLSVKERILNCNAVSIHIRRGDYLQSPVHLDLDLSYYENAIELIKSKVADPCFFIFTDDMKWAKENIVKDNIHYVEANGKDRCHLDMYLNSLCKHNIIANSTFSWWGAWLNKNPKKIVISPKRWLTTTQQPNSLMLKKWMYL